MTSTVSSAEPLVQGAFFKPCELSAPFNWQPGLLRKLDELRCMGQFCDVTIQVDDTIGDASFLPYMRVHSVIVAAGSPMLHEKLQDPSFAGSVLVAGVGVWQWEQVINFLYTGKVCLTASGQAEALVQAAIELKMEVLVNMLQDHLGPSDAAAVEDVKPLKSRQAADTSEPMDDDDEDNDAGAASTDEDREADNIKPLPTVLPALQKNTRGSPRKKNQGDDNLNTLTITEKSPTLQIKLRRLSQKSIALGTSHNAPNLRMKTRRNNTSANLETEEDDVVEHSARENKTRKRTVSCNELISNKTAAGDELSQSLDDALRVSKATPKRQRARSKIRKTCTKCDKVFKYEKYLHNHKCKQSKPTCLKCGQTFPYEGKLLKHSCSEGATTAIPKEEINIVVDELENEHTHIASKEGDGCDTPQEHQEESGTVSKAHRSSTEGDGCDSLEECEEESPTLIKVKKGKKVQKRPKKRAENTCDNCNRIFVNVKSFRKHKCGVVPTLVFRKELLKNYLCQEGEIIDLPIPEIACSMCEQKFAAHNLLVVHASETHGVEICAEESLLPDVLLQCPYCSVTHTEQKLIPHLWKVHGRRVRNQRNQRPRSYHKCLECDYRDGGSAVHRHYISMHAHLRDFMCELCGKRFKRPFNLQQHMLLHTDEKPHECKYCGRLFRDICAVGRHENLHFGHKPYKCNLCGKQFTQVISCNLHMKSSHQHIPREQYSQNRTHTPLNDTIRNSSEVKQLAAARNKERNKKPSPGSDSSPSPSHSTV